MAKKIIIKKTIKQNYTCKDKGASRDTLYVADRTHLQKFIVLDCRKSCFGATEKCNLSIFKDVARSEIITLHKVLANRIYSNLLNYGHPVIYCGG